MFVVKSKSSVQMEMSVVRSYFSQKSSTMEMDIIKTKPLYGKKRFFWELQSIESVMRDGVQRAITCEFEIGHESFSYTNGGSGSSCIPHSKWKLSLDLVDIEPAVTVEKTHPTNKVLYYKFSLRAMKSLKEESDVISFPNTDLFYEANSKEPPRKFSLHKQLDYGSSYSSWFKDVLVGDSLMLKVDFETCESYSTHQS